MTSAAATTVPLGGFPAAAVVIGASTGGPPVVEHILRALPADFPAPVAICQHISPGFVEQWAERLDPLSWLDVKEAENGEAFVRGHVYIAPVGMHLRFWRDGTGPRCRLDADSTGSVHVPCVDFMFTSAAEVFGSRTLGVLLTGLGADGAQGLKDLRQRGAYTLIEDPATAVASSMPESALRLGAVVETVRTDDLPQVIVRRANGDYGG
ncbi:MAG: CheB methylesterase domain-containing protein [Coriobacteriia bacterium]|nr:CheB methylesterase domain-containing protein [Coriobacteriia bacterium]